MQNEFELKKLMCEIGRRVYNRGMVAANDGNFSVKLNDNEFLCTPTGVSKGFMTPEYICKVDAKGNVLQANGNFRPSSEIKMHMRVYEKRPDVGAVVHAHPSYATSFAIAGIPFDSTDYAGSRYRFGMCSDCKIWYTFYNGDSGRCRRILTIL